MRSVFYASMNIDNLIEDAEENTIRTERKSCRTRAPRPCFYKRAINLATDQNSNSKF